jgi:hypothetical protein
MIWNTANGLFEAAHANGLALKAGVAAGVSAERLAVLVAAWKAARAAWWAEVQRVRWATTEWPNHEEIEQVRPEPPEVSGGDDGGGARSGGPSGEDHHRGGGFFTDLVSYDLTVKLRQLS